MRIAPRNLAVLAGLCLSLFGFGFLAGLTVDAPWGAGPAAVCALGAALTAAMPLRWLRGWGGRTAAEPMPAWLEPLTPPFAHGAAVALALAAAASLLAAREWNVVVLFWPACFGLLSACLTVFGDARARAEQSLDEAGEAEGEDAHEEAVGDGNAEPGAADEDGAAAAIAAPAA